MWRRAAGHCSERPASGCSTYTLTKPSCYKIWGDQTQLHLTAPVYGNSFPDCFPIIWVLCSYGKSMEVFQPIVFQKGMICQLSSAVWTPIWGMCRIYCSTLGVRTQPNFFSIILSNLFNHSCLRAYLGWNTCKRKTKIQHTYPYRCESLPFATLFRNAQVKRKWN